MRLQDTRVWRGSRDGPWPVVRVDGELQTAELEWLHTNGAGAYATSTIALMHTRREHGILVAPLNPPVDPVVVVSNVDATIEIRGRSHRLSTHQFPGVAPTPGYRHLKSFAQDPLPRWSYRINKSTLTRTLSLVVGHNSVVLGFSYNGPGPAKLKLRPLMPLRKTSELLHEHGAMVQNVTLRPGQVEVRPVQGLPAVTFGHSGVFMGSPDWWRRFEYLMDRARHSDFCEDQWTPGEFEIELSPRKATYLVIALGSLPTHPPAELMAEMRERLLRQDPGPDKPPSVRFLSVAAHDYCADLADRPGVISGYPWFEVFHRDTLMCLRGLYLARGRIEAAERILARVVSEQRGGLLPLTPQVQTARRTRPCPVATLWLFEAARVFIERVGTSHPFVRGALFSALLRAFVRMRRSVRGAWVYLTPEGLLATESETQPLTWMNALTSAGPVTPRNGLAVELQALWSKGCDTLFQLARSLGQRRVADAALTARDRTRAAFAARFWCNETGYPFDCQSARAGTVDAWADPSIRPNAVIALAMDPDLFTPAQASAILERVRSELLTPHGLRTLSPADPNFVARFTGTADERCAAYHQGTTWPFLLRAYAEAALHASKEPQQTAFELLALLESAADTWHVLGQICQVVDGVAPYRPRGCPAYAPSVAELLSAFLLCREA